jgi:hypothetical protein
MPGLKGLHVSDADKVFKGPVISVDVIDITQYEFHVRFTGEFFR